jgi:divalent metal cation (Fe/Co/Zn/Cd) transporter
MKVNTRKRKESRKVFEQLYGREELTDRMYRIKFTGKEGTECHLSLEQSHELSHEITALIQQQLPDVQDVNVTFETARQRHIVAQDVTGQSADLIGRLDEMINKAPDKLNCHDIKIYRQGEKVSVFLHCGLKGNYGSERIEKLSKNISRRIKKNFTRVDSVHIHVEPLDAKPGDSA